MAVLINAWDGNRDRDDRISTGFRRLIIEPVCSELKHALPADVPGKHENNGSVIRLWIEYFIALLELRALLT
ncbi:hypothetical protein E2986_03677 [Frieseomelitta varia]|uniref:Uncharacterized protein n=1 Tax=Frieseomelitta varia TaxID=561572 RepID=A0A833S982_9HYME|nr:hypothetical protein E2986_03677 [Frieseomelitta varia]